MPSVSNISSTETSVTVEISGMDGAHAGIRYFWWQLCDANDHHLVITEGGSQSQPYATRASYVFSGLTAGTEYYVLVGIYGDSAHTQLYTMLSCSAETETRYSVIVYDNGVPRFAIPWVYDGTRWRKTIPFVYERGWNCCVAQ